MKEFFDYLSEPDNLIMFLILLLVMCFLLASVLGIMAVISDAKQRKQIREDICSGKFLYYKDFEKRWIISSGRGKYGTRNGFKYQDGPGCYVITIYNHPVTDGNYLNYDDIYIGQSVKVCQRVHNHLNGKGNGDVYADVKYGKWVYVRFVRCSRQNMNRVEKKLISAFNATFSYNKTRGGAIRR